MSTPNSPARGRATIVLVHGAFQTAAAWSRVTPRLEDRGFKVLAVNLPGRDGDPTPIEQISLDLYKTTVLDAIARETAPVVLVGHSFGGITISSVAEAAPESLKSLIYLSAYLPRSGDSLQALAQTDGDSVLATPGYFVMSPDYKYASIKDEAKADAFANDATDDDRKAIVASLITEPLAPQATPVTLTAARFGAVRKFYLMTTRDRCVSPALQTRMTTATRPDETVTIDAGHASYVTQADRVARAIGDLAAR